MKKAYSLHIQSHSLSREYAAERTLFRALVATTLMLSALYGYFVVSSALAVIAKNQMSNKIEEVESSVGQLESEYFALSRNMSPEAGSGLGLAPASDTTYVRRPSQTAEVTIKPNAI